MALQEQLINTSHAFIFGLSNYYIRFIFYQG